MDIFSILLFAAGVYLLGRWLKKKKEANEAASQPSLLEKAVRMADSGQAPGAKPGDSRAVLTKKALDHLRAQESGNAPGASVQTPQRAGTNTPVQTPHSASTATSAQAPQSAATTAPAQAPQSAATTASAGQNHGAPSLRSGAPVPACPVCGQPLTGYGEAGGYCATCDAWQYDHAAYEADRQRYGDAAETLHVLIGYDQTHLTGNGINCTGRMLASPGMLLFPSDDVSKEPIKLFFRDFAGGAVTEGAAQQWTLLLRGPANGQTLCLNIDLCGCTYDHSDGLDLKRLKRLSAHA